MNLHNIVRSAITTVNPDEQITLYKAIGQENVKGSVIPKYADPLIVSSQWQPLDADRLAQLEMVNQTVSAEQVFLYSDKSQPISGISRTPIARTGDFLKRGGSWYLVTAVLEDWSNVGWINVEVTLQTRPPEGVI